MIKLIPISPPRAADLKAFYPRYEHKHEKTSRVAKFHGHTELRMGFLVSKLAIYENDKDITEEHLLAENYFYTVPKCYNPWSYNGEILVVQVVTRENLGSEIQFYSLKEKKMVYSVFGGSWVLLCAPSSPYIIKTAYDQSIHRSTPYIADMKGKKIRNIPIKSVPINMFMDWVKEEMKFIAITNDPIKEEKANYWLHYGDGTTGEILDKIPLNPRKIINKDDIKKISVDPNKVINADITKENEIQTEWDNIQYNRKEKVLTLTYSQSIEGKFDDEVFGTVAKIVAIDREFKLEF